MPAAKRFELKYSLTISDFEQRSWRVERVGWLVSLAILAVSIAGGLGSGPLSNATASVAGLTASYQNVVRSHQSAPLTLRVTPTSSSLAVEFDSTLLAVMGEPAFVPAPRGMRATAAGMLVEWDAVAGAEVTIQAPLRVTGLGRRAGQLRLADDTWIGIALFILP